MIAGIERLRHARETLDQSGQSTSYLEALITAAEETWSAAIDGVDWPLDLRVRLAAIQRLIFQHGGIRGTIEGMTEAERSHLQRELLALVAAAERTSLSP